MKKQTVVALILLLLIPMVAILGGLLFSLVNPEIAAGHPNYVRNYHLLSVLKIVSVLTSGAVVGILWLLACFLVIRSKERSSWWLLLAALGPFGIAILAILNDRTTGGTDRHARIVRSLNRFVRVGYKVCRFAAIGLLAFEAIVFKRYLIIMYESVTTGISTAQIMDRQNASSGMRAFREGTEVMFIVALLYLVWPIAFNIAGRMATIMASPKSR